MLVAYGKRGTSISVTVKMITGTTPPDLSSDTGSVIGSLRVRLEDDVTASQKTFTVSDDWADWIAKDDTFKFEKDSDEELTVSEISSAGVITVTARGTTPIAHKKGEFIYIQIFSDTTAGNLSMNSSGQISWIVPVADSKRIKDVLYCLVYRKSAGVGEYIVDPDQGYFEIHVQDLVAPIPAT